MDFRSDPPSPGPPSPGPPSVGPPSVGPSSPGVISCDDCAMQCSSHCDDCVVTFFVRRDEVPEPLVLDHDEAQVVRRLARAGLIPELKYRLAG